MVTIFDMVTGELIHSDAPIKAAQPAKTAEPERTLVAPRLQTVEEAKATEVRHRGIPADMIHTDITSFLDGQ